MKKETGLKIYLLSQTSLLAEWFSLLGDKYLHALPFNIEFTEDINAAEVIAWDGFYNAKGAYYLEEVISRIKSKKSVLLFQYEAFTLFKDDPYLIAINLENEQYVELSGGNILPEDLLSALDMCFKKIHHV